MAAKQSTKTQHICTVCAAPFEVRSGQRLKASFCSRACHHISKQKIVPRTCEHCASVFPVRPHKIKPGRARFCSSTCSKEYRKIPLTVAFGMAAANSNEKGCSLWPRGRNRNGYGLAFFNGRSRLAHRVAWEIANGPIPDGWCVCHKCDVPACVRLDHLFLGTDMDNTADKVRKGRAHQKITAEMARQIHVRHTIEKVSQSQLAREYRVTPRSIRLILLKEPSAVQLKEIDQPQLGGAS